ncbi:hypothetical protein BHE74_00057693, partial [Ensete ventricosum]
IRLQPIPVKLSPISTPTFSNCSKNPAMRVLCIIENKAITSSASSRCNGHQEQHDYDDDDDDDDG